MLDQTMDVELTEPFAVADTFASGLAEVESIGGGNYRFTFFALHRVGGREERQVVAKLIMCADAIPKAMRMTAVATHSCACAAVKGMAH